MYVLLCYYCHFKYCICCLVYWFICVYNSKAKHHQHVGMLTCWYCAFLFCCAKSLIYNPIQNLLKWNLLHFPLFYLIIWILYNDPKKHTILNIASHRCENLSGMMQNYEDSSFPNLNFLLITELTTEYNYTLWSSGSQMFVSFINR